MTTRRHWEPVVRRRTGAIGDRVRQAIGSLAQAAWRLLEEYGTAVAIWTNAQRGRPGRTLTHRVARLLATSPGPMTRAEITKSLSADVAAFGHRAAMRDVTALLHRHLAFYEPTRGRWQLGKENANLGGNVPSPRSSDPLDNFWFSGMDGDRPKSPESRIPSDNRLSARTLVADHEPTDN